MNDVWLVDVQCELIRSINRLVHRRGSLDAPTGDRIRRIVVTLLNL